MISKNNTFEPLPVKVGEGKGSIKNKQKSPESLVPGSKQLIDWNLHGIGPLDGAGRNNGPGNRGMVKKQEGVMIGAILIVGEIPKR